MFKQSSDAVWWYLHELGSQVVAESGIANDRCHIGKIILHSLKDAPEYILQIDGSTDERETSKSALERSVRCASALRNIGLKYQDVIVIMAPNHLDLVIPMYAALYLGIIVAGVEVGLGVSELRDTLKCTEPKIIFCENSNVATVKEALKTLNMSTKIVTFGKKQDDNLSFKELLDRYAGDTTVEQFKPADFDPTQTTAVLVATSGSTGIPKTAALTHKNVFHGFPYILIFNTEFPSPFRTAMVLSPIQWVSATFQFIMSPIARYTRVQSSSTLTTDHVYSLISKYKPEYTIMSPTFMTTVFKRGERDKCDFSSLKIILVGGSVVTKQLLEEVKEVVPKCRVEIGYGMTESSGLVCNPSYSPFGSVGTPLNSVQFKLVDVNTDEVINEPNVSGELRIKGPAVFKGYFNNAQMTAAAFDEDGWLKTGDIHYRDENYNYYFVDRHKLLLKYRNNQVSPAEIERVIIEHPGVLDVAVTGIPHDEFGDLVVAFVVPIKGCTVTAQEIKDLVKASLSDPKQLRGGVIFLPEMPTTSTSKIDRPKLKKMALSSKRE
ncbi:luciferin 4-monooxygenase-like [Vanessa cardui]|uniref:luciferin 4-monooxygenase-like n=1 Tax=Vanessa cardui TaxID=171605 RepID=UPI001F13AF66|nr:luciferin 4-monooxygenase-like [Vanessa cardui]